MTSIILKSRGGRVEIVRRDVYLNDLDIPLDVFNYERFWHGWVYVNMRAGYFERSNLLYG